MWIHAIFRTSFCRLHSCFKFESEIFFFDRLLNVLNAHPHACTITQNYIYKTCIFIWKRSHLLWFDNIREHFRTETYQRRRMCFGNRIMNILYNIHVTLRERICIYSNLLQRTCKVIVEWSLYTCLSVFLSVYYCFRIVHIWFWIYYLGYFNLLSNPYYFQESSKKKLEIRESSALFVSQTTQIYSPYTSNSHKS